MIPDLSHHNLISGWPNLIAAAELGVILKATEGQDWTDPAFHERAARLEKEKVPLGCYHFARPDISSSDARTQGRLEGRHFATVTMGREYPLGRFLDWEATASNATPIDLVSVKFTEAWIFGFLDIVPDGIVYASRGIAERMLGVFPLWVADWTSSVESSLKGHPVVLHQYTSQGSFPGVEGRVDLSRPVASS